VLHTVHGSFNLKSGQVHFAFATNIIGGEIVADAASGNSGSGARDRKMHKEILESAQYSEITFRPDRVEGKVLAIGTSREQVHGVFVIHGAEHEITVPAQVELAPDHWNLTIHVEVPYVKWGLSFGWKRRPTLTCTLRGPVGGSHNANSSVDSLEEAH